MITVSVVGAWAPIASAATIEVTVERRGEIVDIRANASIQSDPATAWRVLTAYDRYAEFIPDLRTSRVIARSGATVTVEQSGDAQFGLLRIPLDITFEIVEFPPSGLRSRATSGILRALESSHRLTPMAQGVRLDYVGSVPSGVGFLGLPEIQAFKQNVARQFQALADEIESESAGGVAHGVGAF